MSVSRFAFTMAVPRGKAQRTLLYSTLLWHPALVGRVQCNAVHERTGFYFFFPLFASSFLACLPLLLVAVKGTTRKPAQRGHRRAGAAEADQRVRKALWAVEIGRAVALSSAKPRRACHPNPNDGRWKEGCTTESVGWDGIEGTDGQGWRGRG